jgi:hypothetical protein
LQDEPHALYCAWPAEIPQDLKVGLSMIMYDRHIKIECVILIEVLRCLNQQVQGMLAEYFGHMNGLVQDRAGLRHFVEARHEPTQCFHLQFFVESLKIIEVNFLYAWVTEKAFDEVCEQLFFKL